VKTFRYHRNIRPARAVSPVHGNTECSSITVHISLGLHYVRLVKQVAQSVRRKGKVLGVSGRSCVIPAMLFLSPEMGLSTAESILACRIRRTVCTKASGVELFNLVTAVYLCKSQKSHIRQ
jgi:hypothetical protein